jgi:hypothetical protein
MLPLINYVYDVLFAARLSAYLLRSGILKVQEHRDFEVLVMNAQNFS